MPKHKLPFDSKDTERLMDNSTDQIFLVEVNPTLVVPANWHITPTAAFKQWIENINNIITNDRYNNTALQTAIKSVIAFDSANKDHYFGDLLFLSVTQNNLRVLQVLINICSSDMIVNHHFSNGDSVLKTAIECNYCEMVKLLLNNKAAVTEDILLIAQTASNSDIVKLIENAYEIAASNEMMLKLVQQEGLIISKPIKTVEQLLETTKLTFVQDRLTYDDLKIIISFIRTSIHLTSLTLPVRCIGSTIIPELAEALEKNTSLTDLYLASNNIGEAGAQALATALEKNTSLTDLYLDDNNIGDVGAQALAMALEKNTGLINLYLGNSNIGAVGNQKLYEMQLQKPYLVIESIDDDRIMDLNKEHRAAFEKMVNNVRAAISVFIELQFESNGQEPLISDEQSDTKFQQKTSLTKELYDFLFLNEQYIKQVFANEKYFVATFKEELLKLSQYPITSIRYLFNNLHNHYNDEFLTINGVAKNPISDDDKHTDSAQPIFPLLDLPKEIQNSIFNFVKYAYTTETAEITKATYTENSSMLVGETEQ